MGRVELEYLEGTNMYVCDKCESHLTSQQDLLSKVKILNIQGFHGKNRESLSF